ALGHVEVSLDADLVADVEVLDPPEGLVAKRVAPGVDLDRAGQVADVEEGGLAVAALADHAPGDPVAERGMLSLSQLGRVVSVENRGDLVPVREPLARV